jgi:hypothetical protein
MPLKIVCSGLLIRHPVGGHTWHHLQYLVGLKRLGHDVTFVEDFGWPEACYDAAAGTMTDDPSFGISYLLPILRKFGLAEDWCYLARDGKAHGMKRDQLAQRCRESDLMLNLSNANWFDELSLCERRAMVDTDPVFTQIGALGPAGNIERHHVLLTYGENIHRANCTMPTAHRQWLPTRQPVVLDLWPVTEGDPTAPITTVMNWAPIEDYEHEPTYGQKSREFRSFFDLPRDSGLKMEIAVGAPGNVVRRLREGGWIFKDPTGVSRDPWTYQQYLASSRAEFCVAKHGYVVTRSGWFSDRSSAYLASGRPVAVQDTGFSDFLPTGRGLLSFTTPDEAKAALRRLDDDYDGHCRAARALIEEHFDARRVLADVLEKCLG